MPSLTTETIVLASTSATRARMLTGAGVSFVTAASKVDEDRIKTRLRARGATPIETAADLARAKADAVIPQYPGMIVVGADQILEFEGTAFDKPLDLADAAAQLRRLSGKKHDQISAVCVMRDETKIWSHEDRATLHMRPLSEAFIESYIDDVGERALDGPGAYQLEGLGAQLFSRIDGDFFSVLGLPLLPLLGCLRAEGVLPS